MSHKILIVDDDKSILGPMKRFLAAHSMGVLVAADGSDALVLARESHPDIILSDAEMPGLDGHTLCRILKKDAGTRGIPIILMSGNRVEEKDILAGFEGGVDDYILKPFSLAVLWAKIQVVLRRYDTTAQKGAELKKCGIELDPLGRTVTAGGKPISLTRKEFDLLATLIEKAGRVLRMSYLLESVWGYDPADYNDPGTVEVHISHLRKKLGKAAKHVVTVPGVGYKFDI